MRGPDDDNVLFLKQAADFLDAWKESKRSGLTAETFLACSSTICALPLLAKHLIEKHGFQYVLLGKFMSDPIEARFGWYRQMNGGNFFMSLRQLLDSEKKIRVLGQLERRMLDDIDDRGFDLPTVTGSATAALGDEDVGWLYDEFTSAGIDLDNMQDTDANVVYYVAATLVVV